MWLKNCHLAFISNLVFEMLKMATIGQTATIFGFGSQGRAQAFNLRDSGWKMRIFLRETSKRLIDAQKEGFEIIHDPIQAAKQSQVCVLLISDSAQPEIWNSFLKPHLPKGAALIFAHGFNIHFKQIVPRADIDCLLIAPALQGDGLRRHYLEKETVPILTAVAQDATNQAYRLLEDFAKAMGGAKTKIIPTTFKEETETDLFAEQAVLCGGLTALIQAGFETLAHAGYNPEIAYFSCLKELKAMSDNIYKYGIQGMRCRISETARYGDLTRGPRVIDVTTKNRFKEILREICSGEFTEELLKEKQKDWPTLRQLWEKAETHPIEKIRKKVENDV